jgi:1-acyl-sn-glycerol-3-phosphate acyltransferase
VSLQARSRAHRAAGHLLRPLLTGLTHRDWQGTEHLPAEGGFVACSNHLSYLDPLTFAHFLLDNGHPPYFLGKEQVFQIPVVGRVLTAAEQIPVRRGTPQAGAALGAALRAVRGGKCVAIFPEATLTRDPQLWPMVAKTGAAQIALATGCPVVPVAQWGPQEVLAPYARRPHPLPRKTVRVRAGAPVDLTDLAAGPIDAAVLAAATGRVMAAITTLLERLRGEPAPAERYDPQGYDPQGYDPQRCDPRQQP